MGTPLSLAAFWQMPAEQRQEVLLRGILEAHSWHYERNPAYRRAVTARGIGAQAEPADLPRLLRPTAQTFKGYIDLLGTPFPQEQPGPFLEWLADQLSLPIPRQRFQQFRRRYGSLEALLQDFERRFADFGLEVSTSSGTSGRSTIMVRSPDSMDRTVESFYRCFQRYFGLQGGPTTKGGVDVTGYRAIFIMPQRTRIAMARMVGFSVSRVGIPEARTHFTIPYPAYPDQVRIRAGRTYRPGAAGWLERRVGNPFMNVMNERLVNPKAVKATLALLERAQEQNEQVLLFGSWVHLHALALRLKEAGQVLHLPEGSVLGTGGGFKERYPFPPEAIRSDLAEWVQLQNGQPARQAPVPLRDVYGMAEGNWAAMQCPQGSYHIPPWVYAVTLDEDGSFQTGPESDGLLAFFDPFGGGDLFPAFFKSADRVRLVHGRCGCGEEGAFITGSIQRVDLLDEAGCAAQV